MGELIIAVVDLLRENAEGLTVREIAERLRERGRIVQELELHRLRLQTFEAIAQQVNLRFHLAGLSDQETRSYIQHHLQVAGVKHALFSDEAIAVIYHFSKGMPRKINNICTACLLDGFLQEKPLIDEATARRALGEFEDDA